MPRIRNIQSRYLRESPGRLYQPGSGTVVAESRDELAGQSVPAPVTLELERLQLPQDVGLVFRGSIEVDGVTAWRSDPRPVDLTSAAIDLGPLLLFLFRLFFRDLGDIDPVVVPEPLGEREFVSDIGTTQALFGGGVQIP